MITSLAVYIVSIVCLVLLAGEVTFVVISAATKDRSDRIVFWRSFKKGKCAMIYITAIPLYLVGYMYAGKDFLKAFFGSVNRIINLVVLKYDTDQIELLMTDNTVYSVAIYSCFILVGINALVLVFSLTAQHLWEFWCSLTTKFTKKDRVFIFGDNEKNRTLFRTDESGRNKTIIDKLDMEGALALYFEKMPYVSTRYSEKMAGKILKGVSKVSTRYDKKIKAIDKKLKKLECNEDKKKIARAEKLRKKKHMLIKTDSVPRKTSVIINTGDDERNMKLCRAFLDGIFDEKTEPKIDVFGKFDLYVYGDPKYEAIYMDIINSARGCFHYTNEYKKVALDFADNYPITRFMDKSYIDYNTALVKDNVDVNVILVGFGKTNQQIFLSSVMGDVLVQKGNAQEPLQKKIRYVVFDKDRDAQDDKNLNHTYFRYEHEMREALAKNGKQKLYLPLPEPPAIVDPQKININDRGFYDTIRDIVIPSEGKKALTYIVIAFGSDLENIDMAQKLVEKRDEWALDSVVIFVKARRWTKEQSFLEQKNCIFIGNDELVGFNLENILSNKWVSFAQIRDAFYEIEKKSVESEEISEALLGANRREVVKKWHSPSRTSYQRESNIYACLNLRLKLNLMGMDYCKRVENPTVKYLTRDEYFKRYLGEKLPEIVKVSSLGRVVFKELARQEVFTDRRGTLATQEHLRWNAYMISQGFIPSTTEQIRNEKNASGEFTNGKNYDLRRHGALTTMKGLVEFRKIVSARDKVGEEESDLIKYDYQIYDEAYWTLDRLGYAMIDKNDFEKAMQDVAAAEKAEKAEKK